jgi:hypothetical protein
LNNYAFSGIKGDNNSEMQQYDQAIKALKDHEMELLNASDLYKIYPLTFQGGQREFLLGERIVVREDQKLVEEILQWKSEQHFECMA